MGPAAILAEPGTDLRLFGKPEVQGRRRLGVALARGQNAEEANAPAAQVQVELDEAVGDR